MASRDPEEAREAQLAANNPAMSVPASQHQQGNPLAADNSADRARMLELVELMRSPVGKRLLQLARDAAGSGSTSSSLRPTYSMPSPNDAFDGAGATHRRQNIRQGSDEATMASETAAGSDPAGDSQHVSPQASKEEQQEAAATITPPAPPTTTKHDHGWRRITRNFSPSWFSVTMGTGIVSELLINITLAFPTQHAWLYWTSAAFFILNTILFTLAFGVSLLRYTLYPEIWGVMIRDPTNSLFLGTIPMGFATLVSAWTSLCVPYWGHWSVLAAWVAWMLDVVVAVAVTVALPFLLMSQSHQQSLERITAAQLLPIASTIVASGTGVNIASSLAASGDDNRALGTLLACYVLWGMATPLAMTVLVIYYQRLALHKLPSREIIVSSFLPLGPLGMGGYAIMRCGVVAKLVFPVTGFLGSVGSVVAGEVLYVLGLFVALVMWGFGLVWLVFALAAIAGSGKFPFNMGELRPLLLCLVLLGGWTGLAWNFCRTRQLERRADNLIQVGGDSPFRLVSTVFRPCTLASRCRVSSSRCWAQSLQLQLWCSGLWSRQERQEVLGEVISFTRLV